MSDSWIKDYPGTLFGEQYTPRFTEVFPDVDTFLNEYKTSAIPSSVTDDSAKLIYYLLYSRWGNNCIASYDTNRFKYDLWATIFSYGPTWEKRLEIQEKLRDLTDDDLFTGATQIYNHSYNPGTAPSTNTLEELTAINEQNTSKHKKDKMSGYAMLISLLETDVTERFIDKFKKLFNNFTIGFRPLYYKTETIDDDIIGDGQGWM